MAIIKDLNTSFGCSSSYHRITSISINYCIKKVIICLASYITKEARINKNNALEEIDIEVPIEDFFHFKDTNVIQSAYNWLKENVVGFEDSTDDLDVIEEVLVTDDKNVTLEAGVINE